MLLLSFLFQGFPLEAAELNSKLETTAQKLTEAAAAREVTPATLAILPFQADVKLSKKRVNFAVSEILTKKLLKLGKFTIIERAQLEEVMKEQKLGLSGAVDSKTAAEIGKLAGAKLLVLGNVIQTGNSYQVTAKLVHAETGEIIASEIIEVPVKTFDEDADRYLVLVPGSQAIGIYLAVGGGYAKKKLPPASFGYSWVGQTNSKTVLRYTGVGLRYFLSPKWMVDAAIMPGLSLSNDSIRYGALPESDSTVGPIKGTMFRLSIDRVWQFSPKFRAHAGAGSMLLSLTRPQGAFTQIKKTNTAGASTIPFMRLGLEYKPQARLGWTIYCQYNIPRKDYQFYRYDELLLVKQFTFPQLTLETTLSLYF